MSKAGNIFSFLAGAAIGSVVTWKLIKNKYAQIAQEEIDSVKEEFSKQHAKTAKLAEKAKELVKEIKGEESADKKEYTGLVKNLGYSNQSDDEHVTKYRAKNKDIYVIPPEIFSDNDYKVVSLVYYADKILAYDDGRIVNNIDELVDSDSLTHFGEYEDDSVFVRNNTLETDFEILADGRRYSDVFSTTLRSANDDQQCETE